MVWNEVIIKMPKIFFESLNYPYFDKKDYFENSKYNYCNVDLYFQIISKLEKNLLDEKKNFFVEFLQFYIK